MILTLALSVLAGLGVAALPLRRRALAWATVLGAALWVEGLAVPIPINQNAIDYRRPGLARRCRDRWRTCRRSTISSRSFHASTPIVELPLGEPAFDVRYMLVFDDATGNRSSTATAAARRPTTSGSIRACRTR